MTRLILGLASLWLAVAAPLKAEPVAVVELFTSQGCSSCPPADKIFKEIAMRDDVVALAYHVDYWDYLGWVDSFADPAFVDIQRAYARAAGERTIYTPQVVIGGTDHVIGSRPMLIANTLRQHLKKPQPATITLSRNGSAIQIRAQAKGPFRSAAVVRLITYLPEATVEIRRGENAGRTLSYANIVLSRDTIGSWNGAGDFQASAKVSSDAPAVVLVQEGESGPILAAAQLR